MTVGFAEDADEKKESHKEMMAQYNLAKESLQGKIMQLQQQLAQHNSDLQQIETQAKFNFKKPQEMVV